MGAVPGGDPHQMAPGARHSSFDKFNQRKYVGPAGGGGAVVLIWGRVQPFLWFFSRIHLVNSDVKTCVDAKTRQIVLKRLFSKGIFSEFALNPASFFRA